MCHMGQLVTEPQVLNLLTKWPGYHLSSIAKDIGITSIGKLLPNPADHLHPSHMDKHAHTHTNGMGENTKRPYEKSTTPAQAREICLFCKDLLSNLQVNS